MKQVSIDLKVKASIVGKLAYLKFHENCYRSLFLCPLTIIDHFQEIEHDLLWILTSSAVVQTNLH